MAMHDLPVRVLFTFAGGSGHAEPLVPLAGPLRDAGHTVAFAGRASVADDLRERGFTVFADPTGPTDVRQAISPLLELSPEREDGVLREGFASSVARTRAARVLALCAEWSPDLIVCDELDFGAMVAAERCGLPHATVLVIAAGSFVRAGVVADPLNALRAEHGLAPDPDLAMVSRDLVLAPCPPSFRDPRFPLPATATSIRPPTPDRCSTPSDATTVYVTLGTVFNGESGDLFARMLSGLRDLPIDLIVTVGRQIDPNRFGPQPTNVRIATYIHHSVVLSRCDLVVSHGGSGSVVGALAAGVPSVVLPMGADQPDNAARCEALGVGRALDAVRATSDTIREAVLSVLSDPAYRIAAERFRTETLALPEPAHAVSLLERLVRG